MKRALHDDVAALGAGAWAEVDDPVGALDRVAIVLDDEHGVAEVAKARERRDQLVVVPLMKADRGLVENVDHADERASDLGGEADALGLAA